MKCTPNIRQNIWRCAFYMSKYSVEFKLEVLKNILENGSTCSQEGKKIGCGKEHVRRWLKRYELHGMKGLLEKKRNYSGDFKLSVIKYIEENYCSAAESAAIFNIPSESTLLAWIESYYKKGTISLYEDKRGRKRMEKLKSNKPKKVKKQSSEVSQDDYIKELLEELEDLRMENEYLKKLKALTQKKKK